MSLLMDFREQIHFYDVHDLKCTIELDENADDKNIAWR